ncbi:hypothetical protein F0U62_21280 [Cystobacter fuscus]|uniref:hypothetical protein n=1 Tax=Cystobacter fuscus TaxID=43 RepID=UPI002B2F1DA1|nr:hypothetical protein F0U62_21280 [Cystobacter fuscus]
MLNVAVRLLLASKQLTLSMGSSDYWCCRDEAQREFLAGAVLYESELPVERVVELIRVVEGRLRDGASDPTAPALELQLLWMEGVHRRTPELTLPNPRVETERWASLVLIESAEDALIEAAHQNAESMSVVKRIGAAYLELKKESGSLQGSFSPAGAVGRYFERTETGLVLESGGLDHSDALVSASQLMLLAERLPPLSALRGSSLQDAHAQMQALAPSAHAFVTLARPSAISAEQYAHLWLEEVRRVAASARLEVTDLVIWESGGSQIRGCLFGAKARDTVFSRRVRELTFSLSEHTPHPRVLVSMRVD